MHGTMSFYGSTKAKTVYGQSSKILFQQKWGIPKVYSFSAFLAGPNLPLESAQNIAKKKLKLFKNLHPQEYQLYKGQPKLKLCQNYLIFTSFESP